MSAIGSTASFSDAFSVPDANRLALLLASTGEGIYGIDNHGACTFINEAGAPGDRTRCEASLGAEKVDATL